MTITRDELEKCLPANLKTAATQQFVDHINTISNEPEYAKQVAENFVSYSSVLKEGRFKTEDYLNAVAYVTYKALGKNNEEAYALTFPTRYRNLIAKGTSSKDISAYVSMYKGGKLVQLIMQQTITPMWVLHNSTYNDAIRVQAELMHSANSEKVRSDAANSLLTHLKPPETKEINLSVGLKEASGVDELRETLRKLAEGQQNMISVGSHSTKDIAGMKLIEGVATEVVNNE